MAMRMNGGLVSGLCVAFFCQTALADEPPATPAAAPPAMQSAAPAAEAKSTAAAATPSEVKPGLTVSAAKPELTPADKELMSRGYKLEMRHGEKYFCRTETETGSRFPVKNCDTAQSIEAHRQESQDAMHSIESNRSRVSN
jgi:hypothetical protein